MPKDRREFRPENEPSWRYNNVGRLILLAFRYFERNLLMRLQAVGFKDVRTVHFSVLRQLDMGGTRIIDIAERAGTTKQAMGQLVVECEKQQLVASHVDPTDRRAKIVTFTGRGRALVEAAHSVVDEIEREFSALVGEREYQIMKSGLGRIAAQPLPEAVSQGKGATRRSDGLARSRAKVAIRKRQSTARKL